MCEQVKRVIVQERFIEDKEDVGIIDGQREKWQQEEMTHAPRGRENNCEISFGKTGRK
jgi:hypothetical protein